MIKSLKTFGIKNFFVLIFLFIITTDIAILLNIPFSRQIFGFLFLTILPGLLILQILKLNKLGFTEKFVLSVGLSIAFLMFFGLLINNLSLSLGYETPLATIPLLISFNLAFVVLAIIGYKINKEPLLSLPNFDLSVSEKAFLIAPVLFPALSILGIHLTNTTNNNIFLILLFFLIPIYVIFLCVYNQKFSNRFYPLIIFLISISLVLLLALRSDHIIGIDTHEEYYFFQTTLNLLHWSVFEPSILNACLSISLLPVIYQSFLNINPEFLFKIIYSLLFSISPLVIYIISKKYIGVLYAFLASFFFMSQQNFLYTALHARTNIATLFFALAIMMLCAEHINPSKRRLLLITFIASCMVSHYSTTYIFFFIMLGAFVSLELLSRRYPIQKEISLTIIILLFAFIFFWYSQVTEYAFRAGVGYVENTIISLNQFFIEELRSEPIRLAMGQEIGRRILSKINFVVTWTTIIFIAIGVITMIMRLKEMVKISMSNNTNPKKPDFLKEKCDAGYFMIALICFGLLVVMTVLPYMSLHYAVDRLYYQALTILSMFFIIGGIVMSKILSSIKQTCRKRLMRTTTQQPFRKNVISNSLGKTKIWAYLTILLVLIPYFLLTSSVIHTIAGVSDSVILNSEGGEYDKMYIHDQESHGAKWLKEYGRYTIGYGQERIHTTDLYVGEHRLMTQGTITPRSIDTQAFQNKKYKIIGYIYLGYYNVVEGKLFGVEPNSCNLSDYSHQFVGKSKIYANGGAEVYR